MFYNFHKNLLKMDQRPNVKGKAIQFGEKKSMFLGFDHILIFNIQSMIYKRKNL